MLESVLEHLRPGSFREEAGIPEGENLSQKDIVVLCVNEILRTVARQNYGIRRTENRVYVFNGAFWKIVPDESLECFLGEAAERLGIDTLIAQHYSFRDQLRKQFDTKASMPLPDTAKHVLINVENGTLEIGTGGVKLREFRAEDFLRCLLPFSFSEQAEYPTWQNFLDRVLPDKESQQVLQEFFGYVFTELKLEKTLLLYGSGANGKSVCFEVMNSLLGEENVTNYSLSSLNNDYQRAMLSGKLLNYASELSGKLEADVFKKLVSGEPVEARLPYEKPFIMRRYARLAFNCNELPRDVEHNEAFFRRFLIIPFNVIIPKEERNTELAKEIICDELPGILNWVLAGLDRLRTQGQFSPCSSSQKILEEYRKESDSVAMFIDEFGYQKTNASEEFVDLDMLYSEYRAFCQHGGCLAVSSPKFRPRLERLGFQWKRRSTGKVVFARKRASSALETDPDNTEEKALEFLKQRAAFLFEDETHHRPLHKPCSWSEENPPYGLKPKRKTTFKEYIEGNGYVIGSKEYVNFRRSWLELAGKKGNLAAKEQVEEYENSLFPILASLPERAHLDSNALTSLTYLTSLTHEQRKRLASAL